MYICMRDVCMRLCSACDIFDYGCSVCNCFYPQSLPLTLDVSDVCMHVLYMYAYRYVCMCVCMCAVHVLYLIMDAVSAIVIIHNRFS